MYGCWVILCIWEQVDSYKSNKMFQLCNENQLVALFILSLFRQSTSTCFGHICSPSSGGILYIYIYTHNNWYMLCFLFDCLLAGLGWICLKHIEVDWWNKLRINSASSWFSLHIHGCIEMYGQQNIKFFYSDRFSSGRPSCLMWRCQWVHWRNECVWLWRQKFKVKYRIMSWMMMNTWKLPTGAGCVFTLAVCSTIRQELGLLAWFCWISVEWCWWRSSRSPFSGLSGISGVCIVSCQDYQDDDDDVKMYVGWSFNSRTDFFPGKL